jgi:hypothetical protein
MSSGVDDICNSFYSAHKWKKFVFSSTL